MGNVYKSLINKSVGWFLTLNSNFLSVFGNYTTDRPPGWEFRMAIIYLPTFTEQKANKCRSIHNFHGSYGYVKPPRNYRQSKLGKPVKQTKDQGLIACTGWKSGWNMMWKMSLKKRHVWPNWIGYLVGDINPVEKCYVVKLDHFPTVRGENENVWVATT